MNPTKSRSRESIATAVVASMLVLILGTWWYLDRARQIIPAALVGYWQNETAILSAKQGQIRLMITPDGRVRIEFDRNRLRWFPGNELFTEIQGNQLRYRLREDQPWQQAIIEWEPNRFRIRYAELEGMEVIFVRAIEEE